MLNNGEILNSLKANGFEIKGDVAVKEQYKVQAIKNAILNEDLRPTIPVHIPSFFRIAITNCWAKEKTIRPTLNQLYEVFSEKLKTENWQRYDDPPLTDLKSSGGDSEGEEQNKSKLIAKLTAKPFYQPCRVDDYPIKFTVKQICLQDVRLKGALCQISFRFRGKTYNSSKHSVNSKKPSEYEFSDSALSKLSFNAMSLSSLYVRIKSGSFRLTLAGRTEIFIGCFTFTLTPENTFVKNTEKISENPNLKERACIVLTTRSGEPNGTMSIKALIEPLNSTPISPTKHLVDNE